MRMSQMNKFGCAVLGILLLIIMYLLYKMKAAISQFDTNYNAWQSLNDNLSADNANNKLELYKTFLKYVYQTQTHCPEKIRAGKLGMGGWDVCLTPPYGLKEGCLVYSFAVADDIKFEEEMASIYGCTVKYHDPRMEQDTFNTLLNTTMRGTDKIKLFKVGVGPADGAHNDHTDWTLKTMDTILEDNDEKQTTIDIVRIDMDWDEWDILKAMCEQHSLRNVKQLIVQIHFNEPKDMNPAGYYEMFDILKQLEVVGFRKYHVEPHEVYNEIFNLYYLNRKYLAFIGH